MEGLQSHSGILRGLNFFRSRNQCMDWYMSGIEMWGDSLHLRFGNNIFVLLRFDVIPIHFVLTQGECGTFVLIQKSIYGLEHVRNSDKG